MNDTKEKHATFTPGPWEIVNLQNKLELYSKENRYCCDQPIATCEPRDINQRAYDINHANARLIAAAPAMYEVLQELAESMELAKNYGYEKEHAMIQEVLAKVDGGEG